MPGALTGKIALVTGAARGIGRAIALKLARGGCDVAVNYYNSADEAEALCAEIRALGRRAVAIQGSVGIPDSVDEIFAELGKHFDRLDILVSNAASGVLKPTVEMTLKHWRWCMETNALALNLLTQRALPLMTGGARVIAMSSLGAQRAMPGYGFIGASKAALESLARALAQELGPRGIRVNVVSAGVVDTDALAYFPESRRAPRELRATHARRPGADAGGRRGRRLPPLPAGGRDDQRPHAGRRRRLRHLRIAWTPEAHCVRFPQRGLVSALRSGRAGADTHAPRSGHCRQVRHRHRRQPRHRARDRAAAGRRKAPT